MLKARLMPVSSESFQDRPVLKYTHARRLIRTSFWVWFRLELRRLERNSSFPQIWKTSALGKWALTCSSTQGSWQRRKSCPQMFTLSTLSTTNGSNSLISSPHPQESTLRSLRYTMLKKCSLWEELCTKKAQVPLRSFCSLTFPWFPKTFQNMTCPKNPSWQAAFGPLSNTQWLFWIQTAQILNAWAILRAKHGCKI